MNIFSLILTTTSIILVSKLTIAADNIGNLCRSNEIEIASCQLEGAHMKTLSICADQQKESISYYFGTRQKIELNVNFSSSNKIYRWLDSETYATLIGFNQAGYSYVFGIPQETLEAKAFLLVKKSSAQLDFSSPRLCTANSFGNKNFMSDAIYDVDDKVVRGKGFQFPPN
jgi:hypothetical protein